MTDMSLAVFNMLGHGDSNGRSVPTLVKDIGVAGHVACGSCHTLVVSQDGWTVWSFGGGDNGALYLSLVFLLFYSTGIFFLILFIC
jgi:hypothetical protein